VDQREEAEGRGRGACLGLEEDEEEEEEEEEEKEAASTRRTVWDEATPGRGRSTRSMCVGQYDEEVLAGLWRRGKERRRLCVCFGFWGRGELS